MTLSAYDMSVLTTFHGNTREARMVRARLLEDDRKYCPVCVTVKSLDAFNDNSHIVSLSGKQCMCRTCSHKRGNNKRGAYTPVSASRTDIETAARHALISE